MAETEVVLQETFQREMSSEETENVIKLSRTVIINSVTGQKTGR